MGGRLGGGFAGTWTGLQASPTVARIAQDGSQQTTHRAAGQDLLLKLGVSGVQSMAHGSPKDT